MSVCHPYAPGSPICPMDGTCEICNDAYDRIDRDRRGLIWWLAQPKATNGFLWLAGLAMLIALIADLTQR